MSDKSAEGTDSRGWSVYALFTRGLRCRIQPWRHGAFVLYVRISTDRGARSVGADRVEDETRNGIRLLQSAFGYGLSASMLFAASDAVRPEAAFLVSAAISIAAARNVIIQSRSKRLPSHKDGRPVIVIS